MTDLSGKNILLLGFGGEARAALRYISSSFKGVTIGVADQAERLEFSEAEQSSISALYCGDQWLEKPAGYDVIIRTPGVALAKAALLRGKNPDATFTSGTNLFLSRHASRTWAVTGTKGKSTTSSLLAAALRLVVPDLAFGGNIGIPALSLINHSTDLFVLELSSYQLEDCEHSPHGALFLNLFAEHLDHHLTHEAYGAAKARIALSQKSHDVLVLPCGNPVLHELTSSSQAKRLLFGAETGRAWIDQGWYCFKDAGEISRKVCRVDQTRLKGPGNHQNIQAVLTALSEWDVPLEPLAQVITDFAPLPHRLEEIGTVNEVCFINDSISTVPEATINALETFGDAVSTLILGGFDRGISFEHLAEYLVGSSVQTILLFAPSGLRIRRAIHEAAGIAGKEFQMVDVTSMEQAVELACSCTPQGKTCLLSPASPSFPLFRNFEQRGAVFRELVLSRIS